MSEIKLEEKNLRPQYLHEYIGQEKIIETLRLFIEGVKKRGSPSEHILFYGPAGIGKTTLSYVIANELRGELKVTSGAVLTRAADFATILTGLNDNDVLFIDEIHRIPRTIEELLYPVMEEFTLDIIIGKGPTARTVRLPVPKITIVGATTKLAHLTAPLRDRFGLVIRLDYYSQDAMEHIVKRSAQLLEIPLTDTAVTEIAKRSRGTPRLANRLLKRVRDMYQTQNHKHISHIELSHLFHLLNIDEQGLLDIDIKYLRLLAEKFGGQAVGLQTIANALSEDERTIEEFIEPYLLQLGFVQKTSKGRIITPQGLIHLGLNREDTLI